MRVAGPCRAGAVVVHELRSSKRVGKVLGRRHADRKSGLDGGYAVDSPASEDGVGSPRKIAEEGLAPAEGQVEDVAEHETLRYVERRQRFERPEIVVIAPGGPALRAEALEAIQPTGKRASVRDQLSGSIGGQQARAPLEAPLHLGLKGVVGRAAVGRPGHFHVRELRIGTKQLPACDSRLRQRPSGDGRAVKRVRHLLV